MITNGEQVTFHGEAAATVRETAAKQGLAPDESLRRAIGVYSFLVDQTEQGCNIIVADDTANTRQELVIDGVQISE